MTPRQLRALLFTLENQDKPITDLRLSKAGGTLHVTQGSKAKSMYLSDLYPGGHR
jgi:hypothetical protein